MYSVWARSLLYHRRRFLLAKFVVGSLPCSQSSLLVLNCLKQAFPRNQTQVVASETTTNYNKFQGVSMVNMKNKFYLLVFHLVLSWFC